MNLSQILSDFAITNGGFDSFLALLGLVPVGIILAGICRILGLGFRQLVRWFALRF